ncbi:MAG: 6-phosphogluconolactonase [Ginsengibacter sp.]
MNLHIFKNKEELSYQLALWICGLIKETLIKQEHFTLVLSGGETPKLLFKKLASQEFKDKIDWKRIRIFWGDERVVPFDDSRNNAKMAFDILLDHVDVPADNIHIMRTDVEPVFSAEAYEKILQRYFSHTPGSFDLVLLGMGDDGHTLSLFPGSPIIEDTTHWVNSVYNAKQEMYRITLMPALVNKASKIVFMVDGAKKAKILQQVLEAEYNPTQLPAQIIKPKEGALHWFLDEAAAHELHSS